MMTFAPRTILEVRAFLKGQDPDLSDPEVGIVGGPSHIATGTSYHLGADQLKMYKNPYSVRTSRDRAGLSNASSALDVDDDLDELRELSVWCVAECRKNAPDTRDLREIIYSPDGVQVLQWDRERGVNSEPRPHSDLSHRTHTHFSWYRDSEQRDKSGLFKRFYAERSAGGAGDDDMFCAQGDKNEKVRALQIRIVKAGGFVGPLDESGAPVAHPSGDNFHYCDGDYGKNTARGLASLLGGGNDGTKYTGWEEGALDDLVFKARMAKAGNPPDSAALTPVVRGVVRAEIAAARLVPGQ